MKKRLILIFLIIIIVIIGIEIYIRSKTKTNYLELDYEISYKEDSNNEIKKLTENSLYIFYFKNYDANNYIEFSNGDKFLIEDAFNNGYLFLGDIIKEVEILRESNFSLNVILNNKNKLIEMINTEDLIVNYYGIESVNLISKDSSIDKSIIEIISNKIISIDSFIETLNGDVFFNKCIYSDNKDYFLYEYVNYNILISKDNKQIVFGNKNLGLETLTKYE